MIELARVHHPLVSNALSVSRLQSALKYAATQPETRPVTYPETPSSAITKLESVSYGLSKKASRPDLPLNSSISPFANRRAYASPRPAIRLARRKIVMIRFRSFVALCERFDCRLAGPAGGAAHARRGDLRVRAGAAAAPRRMQPNRARRMVLKGLEDWSQPTN